MFNYGFTGNTYGVNTTPQFYTQPATKSIYYASEDEIRGYILQPNNQIMAIDREKPFFYIKSADNLGRSTMSKYKFEEVRESEEIPPKSDYLTKADLNGLVRREDLETLALKSDLEELKKIVLRGVKNEPAKVN